MARSPFPSTGDPSILEERHVEGTPRYELSPWRGLYEVIAGITGRGAAAFDLGLWGGAPAGEVMGRWRAFRRTMPEFGTVVLGGQVHGVRVETVDGGRRWIQVDGVDGWVTAKPGILLTVTVADCIPVYLAAPGRGIALLHAGWRGTAGGILSRGVARLAEVGGCPPAEIIMHCGIGICGDCYEVGSEVMEGCGCPHEGSGPWHLDLRGYLKEEAHRLGLRTVTGSPWCSAHHAARFYSHRASRGADGRMVAYLGMLPK